MRSAVAIASLFILMIASPFVSAADGDGDGIDDTLDMCPFAAGTANSTAGNGCPDSNGNGIADFEEPVVHDWSNSQQESRDTSSVGGGVEGMEWAKNDTMFYAGGSGGGWGGGGGNVTVHKFNSLGIHIGPFAAMPGSINVIEQSPDETMIAVASDDGGARVFNSTTGALIVDLYNTTFQVENDTDNVISLSWSNDGNRLFLSPGQSKISSIWTSNWSVEWNYTGLPSWVGAIDTTPDDRLLIFSSGSMLMAYWVSNFTEAWNMTNHTDHIRIATVSPDGRYVASGSNNNKVVITNISNNSKVAEMDVSSDAAHGEFSPDGGTFVVGSRRSSTLRTYETQSWTSTGTVSGFGSSNNNRGIYSVSFNSDGERLAVGWRRGYVSLHIVADGHIRVHGEFSSTLMEPSWRTWFPTTSQTVRVWDEYERTTTTADLCAGKSYLGSHTNGVSTDYANKSANYYDSGIWDCKYTAGQILEVPYGRMAGAFSVKSGGDTEACIKQMGGLSMGQLRWITSSLSRNVLKIDSEMPGLDFSSIAPNDDLDATPEWRDFDASCPDEDIMVAHRWENRTEMWIIKETLLCANCVNKDTIYPSSGQRYRAVVGEFREDVISGVTGPSGEGSIGFTELGFTIDNANGIYIVPLVDNFTHGASDAIAAGQESVNATRNNSRNGSWPLQTDSRMYMSTDALAKNIVFAKFLLTDPAALQWEAMGFTRLGSWDTYRAWLRLGVDMSHILPDFDDDGVWDGWDECPDTIPGSIVDEVGCAEYELDDDDDGFTNDLDDCDNISGTSNFGLVGCPDSDGDGWADDTDSHPSDVTEWNDTDMDTFGDNSDDCVDIAGNSTEDRSGCIDSDGDGWSDEADEYPDDPSEWADTDGDGYGDNQDAFPYAVSQWSDQDSDGYGDNETGIEADTCPTENGSSRENGIFGCIDSDSDGWADIDDDLPFNPDQHTDTDGDGLGDKETSSAYDHCIDTPSDEITMIDEKGCGPSQRDSDSDSLFDDVDECPNTPIMQSANVNAVGCAPSEIDLDGDGATSDIDWDDNNPSQISDTDGDGFGDNTSASDGDDCPTWGNSTLDRRGCKDSDGDGWSDETSSWSLLDGADAFPDDPTQWRDTDMDSFGDNWDDESWSENRTYGVFLEGATQPDRCPNTYSQYSYSEYQGCLTKLAVENIEQDDLGSDEEDSGLDILIMFALISIGVVFILIGAVVTLIKKKPKGRKRKKRSDDAVKTFADEPELEIPAIGQTTATSITHNVTTYNIQDSAISGDMAPALDLDKSGNTEEANSLVTSVSTWEELPSGKWLDEDEKGISWYLGDDGRHWFSTDDGFRVWKQ